MAPWIFSTCTRLAMDRLRHRARRDAAWQEQVQAAARAEGGDPATPGPRRGRRRPAARAACARVIADLDRETQQVVVLVLLRGADPRGGGGGPGPAARGGRRAHPPLSGPGQRPVKTGEA